MHDHTRASDGVLPPSERPSHQIGETGSAESIGTTGGGAGSSGAIRDPRGVNSLSDRHIAVLTSIGQGLRAKYQLQARHFQNRSETPVLRTLYCLESLGLIQLERWNRNGILLARLREAGRQLLISLGISEEEILVARAARPATLQHTLWIGDVAVAISKLPTPHEYDPCWTLRRKYPDREVIPDLLVRRRDGQRTIAIEIDLGTESLRRVLVPKLTLLARALPSWSPAARTSILVLMNGARRLESLRHTVEQFPIPVAVGALPGAIGMPAIEALGALFGDVRPRP